MLRDVCIHWPEGLIMLSVEFNLNYRFRQITTLSIPCGYTSDIRVDKALHSPQYIARGHPELSWAGDTHQISREDRTLYILGGK